MRRLQPCESARDFKSDSFQQQNEQVRHNYFPPVLMILEDKEKKKNMAGEQRA